MRSKGSILSKQYNSALLVTMVYFPSIWKIHLLFSQITGKSPPPIMAIPTYGDVVRISENKCKTASTQPQKLHSVTNKLVIWMLNIFNFVVVLIQLSIFLYFFNLRHYHYAILGNILCKYSNSPIICLLFIYKHYLWLVTFWMRGKREFNQES